MLLAKMACLPTKLGSVAHSEGSGLKSPCNQSSVNRFMETKTSTHKEDEDREARFRGIFLSRALV
jgi:hypothetical protein